MMKHLNDFQFADMEYSTYLQYDGRYAVDIRDAEGEVLKGVCDLETEVEAVAWAEDYLINNYCK